MNREDIIKLAKEAGIGQTGPWFNCIDEELERFAKLVAAAERKWTKREWKKAQVKAWNEKPQITHAENCWSWGPAHYECACAEIAKLKGWAK